MAKTAVIKILGKWLGHRAILASSPIKSPVNRRQLTYISTRGLVCNYVEAGPYKNSLLQDQLNSIPGREIF